MIRPLKLMVCASVVALIGAIAVGPAFAAQGGVPSGQASDGPNGNGAGSSNAHGGNSSANPASSANPNSQGNAGVTGNDGSGSGGSPN